MKKILTVTVILVTSVFTCFSQDLTGKWYMVNRSGLIELSITNDSIKSRKLSTDFVPIDELVESFQLLRTVMLKDRILLISRADNDSTQFTAMTLINYSSQKHFQLSWNGLDTVTNTIESLIEVNSNDNRQLYGYYVFAEEFIDTLRTMKSIQEMTLNDFKKYSRVYVDKVKLTRDEFDKYNFGYVAVLYNFQLITQALYDMGFNPLVNIRTIEPIFVKYKDDLEVQAIWESLNK
jgi:hypothetical protein